MVNISYLEQNYRHFKNFIIPYILKKLDNPLDENYILEKNKELNCFNLKVKQNNNFIYLTNKNNPIIESKKFIEGLNIDTYDIILIIGGGLGYISQELQKVISLNNKIIILEPNIEIFKACMICNDMTDIFEDDRFTYILNDNLENLAIELKNNLSNPDLYRIKIHINPDYKDIFNEQIVSLNEIIYNYIIHLKIKNKTNITFSSKWHLNSMTNIFNLFSSHSVNNFKDIFKNKPVIIVSSGPSLTKNIELLKEIKGKVLILSVYTSLKILDENNITPDIVFAVDGEQLVYDNFKNIEFDMPLFYKTSLNPKILDLHKGKKIFSKNISDLSYSELFKYTDKQIDQLESGGSVACETLDFAIYMGCSTVIFIGQDLAFTGNKTHVDGTYYDGKNNISIDTLSNNIDFFTILDIYGNVVYTDDILCSFLKWFENYIQLNNISEKNTIFINATEGGANIKGASNYTLRNAIDEFCLNNNYVDVDLLLSKSFENNTVFGQNDISKMLLFFENITLNLKELSPFLERGILLSKNLKQMHSSNTKINEDMKKDFIQSFIEIDNAINKSSTELSFLNLLFQNAVDIILKSIYTSRNNINFAIQTTSESLLIYTTMYEILAENIPYMEDIIKKLKIFKL